MKNKIKAILFASAMMLTTVLAGSLTANAETPEIMYQGKDSGIEWSIDANGHLLLTGDGDFFGNPEWTADVYREKVKTVTVKVKNMTDAYGMFDDCVNLKSADLSEFDTSKITDMGSMFVGCENLTSLDLSGFKTGKVKDMSGMFYKCENLTSLDLSRFDTKHVTTTSSMFYDCTRLKELDLGNWDLSSLTTATTMFDGTKSLARITLPNLPVDIDLSDMFYDEKHSLTDIAKAGRGKVTYIRAAYGDSYCYKNGHTYSLPNFTWAEDYSSATVYFECTRKDCKFDVDEKCVQMGATVTKTVVNPTTEKEGATVYTATAVHKGKTYTDVKRIAIPKLPAQPQTPTAKPIGTSFKTSTTLYRVTKSGKTPEIAYMGPRNKKVKKVTIPATVTIDGVTYKVTSVATGALKKYKNLTTVTVGKNVTKIGKNAFYGCKKLKKIVIKSKKIKSVGKNAIKGIKKNATIDVPNSKKKAYKKLFKAKTGYKKKTMKMK